MSQSQLTPVSQYNGGIIVSQYHGDILVSQYLGFIESQCLINRCHNDRVPWFYNVKLPWCHNVMLT